MWDKEAKNGLGEGSCGARLNALNFVVQRCQFYEPKVADKLMPHVFKHAEGSEPWAPTPGSPGTLILYSIFDHVDCVPEALAAAAMVAAPKAVADTPLGDGDLPLALCWPLGTGVWSLAYGVPLESSLRPDENTAARPARDEACGS